MMSRDCRVVTGETEEKDVIGEGIGEILRVNLVKHINLLLTGMLTSIHLRLRRWQRCVQPAPVHPPRLY